MMYDDPIVAYSPVWGWAGWAGGPIVSTLDSSYVATINFSPCSYLINDQALKAKNETGAKWIQGLHYLSQPIDGVIQAIAMPIFTLIDHFRDISRSSLGVKCIKVICTPISLPVKLAYALFCSVCFFVKGVGQLVFPVTAIRGALDGKQAANEFFYEIYEMKQRHQFPVYLKPIEILSPIHDGDNNPLCKKRNELFNAIDSEFRNFNHNLAMTSNEVMVKWRRHGEIAAIKKRYGDFCTQHSSYTDADRLGSTEYQALKGELDNVSLEAAEIESYFKKRVEADRKFSQIKKLHPVLFMDHQFRVL